MTSHLRGKRLFHAGAVLSAIIASGSLAFAQQPAASAGGTSTERSVRCRIVGEGGRPVVGAQVRASVIEAAGSFSGEIEAVSNGEGEVELKEFPAGIGTLSISAPPFVVVDGIPDEGVSAGAVLTVRMARGAAITGRVVDEDGRPLTGLRVTPELVRDANGVRVADGEVRHYGGLVDDRGEYRIYGLEAGTYIVSAAAQSLDPDRPEFLTDRTPTYYPSADRPSAAEITASLGSEVTKIDIAFRGAAGHRVSGSILGAATPNSGWMRVQLFRKGDAAPMLYGAVRGRPDDLRFFFDGVEDGDFELEARAAGSGGDQVSTDRVPVRVRGADASGITLTLLPTGRISGKFEIDAEMKTAACGEGEASIGQRSVQLADIAVGFREISPRRISPRWTGVKADGSFVASSLSSARYRLWAEFADDDVYAVSSTVARDGVVVARGKSVDGLRFVVARGAARMRGRLAPAKDGEPLPSRTRVCLVPADPKHKDEVIYYYEVDVERDGTFDVRNVAPGEYFVATRTFPGDDRPDFEIFPAAWDAAERAKLRAMAEKAGVRVTLSPCQRLESAVITLTQF